MILMATLALAVIGGLAAAVGAVLIVGVIAAVAVGIGIMLFPKLHILFGMIFALVITGVLEFFFYFGQANWLSSVIVASMMLPALLRLLGMSQERDGVSAFAAILVAYIVGLLASSVINRIPVPQVIVGVRNYLPYIGVAMLIVYGGFEIGFVRKVLRALLFIALIQIPVAIYQHIVVGPARVAMRGAVGREDEAIVGTFGGSIVTGGYTGEMASFLVMAVMFVIALWRERKLKGWLAAVFSIALLIPVLLAETKIALLLLPVLSLIAFGSDIKKSPATAVVGLIGVALLMTAVGGVYALKYWQSSDQAASQLLYSFDPDFMVTPDHRGRVGTIVHWYQTNLQEGNYVGALIGHGMASSLEGSSTIGLGSAVRQFGLGLDAHGMSRLLWDGGMLVFSLFAMLCVRTIYVASKLRKKDSIASEDRAGLTFALVAATSMFLMLPYQMSVLGGSAMQFVFWCVVGYVEYMRRACSAAHKSEERSFGFAVGCRLASQRRMLNSK
ncbi:hypothetical protein ACG02S_24375 [Roseateles sp. DC23W]|uniref:O-Antigen ligase n=1 Tax=Pelomonas dachongensis TaxID=3299029 RepID=A0ABW7EUA5_9BURK